MDRFFYKAIKDERLPSFLYEFDFATTTKIDLAKPNIYICEYVAKTYTDGQPNNRYHLHILQEFDIDAAAEIYALLATLAGFAEDNAMAGYIKDETGNTNLFAFKEELIYWQMNVKIETENAKPLNYFDLVAIGYKIVNTEGTEAEINKLMNVFDKNVPHPNGSNFFFYPENYNARKDDISTYKPTVEEVVQMCLDYKPIEL